MTRDELISKIENGTEMAFLIGHRGFTVFNYNGDPDIGEWDKPETVKKFKDAKSLVDGFKIGELTLAEQSKAIKITEYS